MNYHSITTTNNVTKTNVLRGLKSAKKLGKIMRFTSTLQYMRVIDKASLAELGAYTRNNLTSLGTTFIKIGQLLSTRSDILDKEFTEQLASLQDKVPPFDVSMYCQYIQSITDEFETEPIASASIGQVHKGKLTSGETVAIKLKRPNIEEEIQTDFQMLLGFLAFLRSFSDRRELYELETVFKQYETLLSEEIQFIQEVENLKKFYRMFGPENTLNKDFSKWIRVPYVYDKLSTNDVIVMEYLPAIKINNFEAIDKMNFDRGKIAEKLVECYIIQIVEYGTIHIDPHPGNVGITTSGKIVFYDYGMVTEISPILIQKFQDLLIAVSEKDAETIARVMIEAEIVTIEPNKFAYLRSFVLSFLEYIESVDVTSFKDNFIDKLNSRDLPFLISSNFLLILRGITILEGVCKQLDPNFNYKKVIDPYISSSFPVDIEYLEKRALKDIENIQKFAFPQMLNDTQRNDIDKQLLEIRLKDMTAERQQAADKQQMSNIIIALLFLAVGVGEQALWDNTIFQVGVFGLTIMALYNKK